MKTRRNGMQIICHHQELQETEVHIYHNKPLDYETKELLHYLQSFSQTTLGYDESQTYRIYLKDIYYIESVDDKTFLYTKDQFYYSKNKLYEWENQLKKTSFVRISKNTIVNIHYLKSVKSLLGGRMEITLVNQEHLIINRHYLSAFKKKFGL